MLLIYFGYSHLHSLDWCWTGRCGWNAFISIQRLLPTHRLPVTVSINQRFQLTLQGSVPTQRRPVRSDQYHCCLRRCQLRPLTSAASWPLWVFPPALSGLPPLFVLSPLRKRRSLRKCHELRRALTDDISSCRWTTGGRQPHWGDIWVRVRLWMKRLLLMPRKTMLRHRILCTRRDSAGRI